MLRSLTFTLGCLLFGASLAWAADAKPKELLVGDPAPPLAVKEFVKGEPVKEFAKGKVYVIEFWATWCGPCIKSIPHVTELQAKHKEAVFIGVDVLESADDAVKAFVKKMGPKMEYRVAIDALNAKADDPETGVMAKTWLEASYQEGIPASFIIDQNGKVAWIGHPMELDEPLEKIIAGKWDLAAAAKEFKSQIELSQTTKKLVEEVDAALEAGDSAKVVKLIDAAVAKHVDLELQFGAQKFNALLSIEKERPAALAYGKQLIEKVGKEDPNILYNVTNALLTDDDDKPLDKLDAATGKLALQAAGQLVKVLTELEGVGNDDRSIVTELLAQAHFATGNAKEAVSVQQQAIKLAKGTEREKDAELAAKLKKYEAGVKK
jgi:thiol-disulfide isomerase/thioredoxin